MIRVRFNSKDCKLTAIQCYAPTNEAEEGDCDTWYEQPPLATSNMLMIIGDMNAKVEADSTNCYSAIRKHDCGEIKDMVSALLAFV